MRSNWAVLQTPADHPVPASELARQVFLLCERLEELPDRAQDSQEVECFKSGQRFAAKHIRDTIGTWLTDEEKTRRALGPKVEVEALAAGKAPRTPS